MKEETAMHNDIRPTSFLHMLAIAAVFVCVFLVGLPLPGSEALAQVTGGPDVNTSQKAGAERECAIVLSAGSG